jgi:hypothetical protein
MDLLKKFGQFFVAPATESPKRRAAQGGLLLGDGSIWRLRYLAAGFGIR